MLGVSQKWVSGLNLLYHLMAIWEKKLLFWEQCLQACRYSSYKCQLLHSCTCHGGRVRIFMLVGTEWKEIYLVLVQSNIKLFSLRFSVYSGNTNICFPSNIYALVLLLNKLTNQNCSSSSIILTFKWPIPIDSVKSRKEWWKLMVKFSW